MNRPDQALPVVELRIKYLGEEMVSQFCDHIESIRPYVKKAVDAYMSPVNLERVIGAQVEKAVTGAINEALCSYEVGRALRKIVVDGLVQGLPKEEHERDGDG